MTYLPQDIPYKSYTTQHTYITKMADIYIQSQYNGSNGFGYNIITPFSPYLSLNPLYKLLKQKLSSYYIDINILKKYNTHYPLTC
jgi:hypothetical protein